MNERRIRGDDDAAAALWAVRCADAPLAAAEQGALEAWLADDSRRVGAFVRAQAMLIHVGRIKALGSDFDPDAYDRGHAAAMTRPVPSDADGRNPNRRRFLAGGSAALAAGIFGMASIPWQAAAATYSTKRGEIRLVPLADGSSMTLNTQTTAYVRFTKSERRLELVGGEALFNVLGDAKRPFVIQCGATCLTGGSASLMVTRLPERSVKVTVAQGRVAVGMAGAAPQIIGANARAVVDTDDHAVHLEPMAPAEIDRQLAWRQGLLSFEDTSLAAAAAEFARYSDVSIRFDNPSIERDTVTGLYSANNPEGFARSVALSLGLQASDRPGAIVLQQRVK